jgi:hypothetical protein
MKDSLTQAFSGNIPQDSAITFGIIVGPLVFAKLVHGEGIDPEPEIRGDQAPAKPSTRKRTES